MVLITIVFHEIEAGFTLDLFWIIWWSPKMGLPLDRWMVDFMKNPNISNGEPVDGCAGNPNHQLIDGNHPMIYRVSTIQG